MSRVGIRYLVSLPVASVRDFAALSAARSREWCAASDPPGAPLGSAGGSVHLLREAWRAEGQPGALLTWATSRPTVMVHGSGQSRRLPAYAPSGKPLIPMPVLRGSYGQRLDQTLLDLQSESLDTVIARSPHSSPLLISSGDVLVLPGTDLEQLPDADVVALGIRAAPNVASHFGVFVRRRGSLQIETTLQKPSAEELADLDPSNEYLVDVGVWVLGSRAVAALIGRCLSGAAESSSVLPCDLYADMGRALGRSPSVPDAAFSALSSVVVEITDGAFYHFGTSRQLIETTCELQNDSLMVGRVRGPRAHPDQILQNARMDSPTRRVANHTLWVENSHVPHTWELRHSHVITGVPDNSASVALDLGVCIDMVPVLDGGLALRPYGLDDPFRGTVGAPDTLWLGRPVMEWFASRGISLEDAGIEHASDIHLAPLFPTIPDLRRDESLLGWMVAARPATDARMRDRWLNLPRLSAADLLTQADVASLVGCRRAHMEDTVRRLHGNRAFSVFYRLDLGAASRLTSNVETPQETGPDAPPINRMYDWAWIGAVRRVHGGDVGSADAEAFRALREGILDEVLQSPVSPQRTVLADQIVWARSPVRLDLAGGWTDTPPYCIVHGGRVANVAVNLNGQPPVQCFVRVTDTPEIALHSIDRGDNERICTYSDLDAFSHPGSSFAIAKAALSLVGFLPRFASERSEDELADRLVRFGGGLEISVLSAVPQGSGLGTSSILGATILAALSDVCGLSWDLGKIVNRTLALEQLMTTGGGWQDQAGGAWHGVKLVESAPGLHQELAVRWLPSDALTSGCALLYYTGLTRLAKGILQDIVHGLFVNDRERLRIIQQIGQNADAAAEALQRRDEARLGDVIATSWDLNRALDAGTDPPAVAAILAQVQDWLRGAKLLGAGGGGYLLMLAKDPEAARRIRCELTERAPNDRARFVEFNVSTTGLEVTRS